MPKKGYNRNIKKKVRELQKKRKIISLFLYKRTKKNQNVQHHQQQQSNFICYDNSHSSNKKPFPLHHHRKVPLSDPSRLPIDHFQSSPESLLQLLCSSFTTREAFFAAEQQSPQNTTTTTKKASERSPVRRCVTATPAAIAKSDVDFNNKAIT